MHIFSVWRTWLCVFRNLFRQ